MHPTPDSPRPLDGRTLDLAGKEFTMSNHEYALNSEDRSKVVDQMDHLLADSY